MQRNHKTAGAQSSPTMSLKFRGMDLEITANTTEIVIRIKKGNLPP